MKQLKRNMLKITLEINHLFSDYFLQNANLMRALLRNIRVKLIKKINFEIGLNSFELLA